MMKSGRGLVVTLLGAVMLTPVAAHADRWYFGGGMGLTMSSSLSSSEYAAHLATQGITARTVSADERDMGYKIFQGYRLSQSLAIEAHYTNLGSPVSYTASVLPNGRDRDDVMRVSGFGADLVGYFPVNPNVTAFGKAGFYRAKTSRTIDGVQLNTSDGHPKFGLGLDFTLSPTSAFRVEWERFTKVGDKSNTGEGGVDFWSASLVLNLQDSKKNRKRVAKKVRQQQIQPVAQAEPQPVAEPEPEPVAINADDSAAESDGTEISFDSGLMPSAAGLYAGVGVSRVAMQNKDVKIEANPVMLTGKVGVKLSKNLAAEGRLGLGLTGDSIKLAGTATPVDTDIDWYYGMFAKGMFPVSPQASIYALGGYAQLNTTVTSAALTGEAQDSGLSYGLGLDFAVSGRLVANVEWLRLTADDSDHDALSAGIDYKF